MALLSQTALRGDPVLNHNFVVSLLDTSSALATGKSIALSAIFDVAVGRLQRGHRGWRCRCSPRSTRRAARNGEVLSSRTASHRRTSH